MPYEVVTPAIQTVLFELFEADTALAGLLASKPTPRGGGPAIYVDGDVYQGQTFPYLTIGAWTQVPFHNLSPDGTGYGWNCTVQIKATGQRSPDLYDVMSAVFGIVPHGQACQIDGYDSGWFDECNLQPILKSTLAGVVTYELPAILRVYVS
jgi:hypothetical protein